MNSVIIAAVALGSFYMAYKLYGRFLAGNVFSVDPERQTPSVEFEDGVDYVPTDSKVLWGHHFTSIAGAAPIVGPAIGVIWGWVPALLWVVLGTIFMGAVHDFGALILSVRHGGRSVGELTGGLVSKRSRVLFLLIILFLLWLVIAVFALIIAILFTQYPATVIPIWSQMALAVLVGYGIYRLNWGIVLPAVGALIIMYALIWVGASYPVSLTSLGVPEGSQTVVWIWIICGYALVASVLPVWVLLQPRDFINAEQLVVALVALYGGLLVAHRPIVAPAFRFNPEGAPLLFPFLFITIACGAISGFHSLVSSGTSAKQLKSERDGQFVGYGGMVAEGVLAVVAVLACVAGFQSQSAWSEHYASWGAAQGLGAKLGAFVTGGRLFVTSLGIPAAVAEAFLAVVIVSFAMTTIDTATRLQRYILSELGDSFRSLAPLRNRYLAGVVAVGSALLLALIKGGGKGGLILWPVFGTTNQLLAGLALVVITIWLLSQRKPTIYTLLPMLFMLAMTTTAIIMNIRRFVMEKEWLLAGVGCIIFLLALWLVIEAAGAWQRARRAPGSVGLPAEKAEPGTPAEAGTPRGPTC
ncbi:MAG: carbon starvation protein A [Candidatus Brocadiia bacterium]